MVMPLCKSPTYDKNIKFDKELSFAVVFHLYFMQCKNMLVTTSFLLAYNEILNNIALAVIIGLYLVVYIRCRVHNRLNVKTLGVLIVIALFWYLSYLFDPKLFVADYFPYSYVLRNVRLFFAYCLPLFITITFLNHTEYLLQYLYRGVFISFFVAVIATFLFFTNPGDKTGLYAMSFGNNLLLTSVLFIFRDLQKSQFENIVCFILTTLFIVLIGSRGPLVSVFALLLYYILKRKKTVKYTVFVYFSLVMLIFIVLGFDVIITWLISLLDSVGLSSRTLRFIQMGIITYDSGRSYYYEGVINAINESPWFCLGAFGGEKTVGLTHSLYLDMLANFGYFFGAFLILWVFYHVARAFRNQGFEKSSADLIKMMAFLCLTRGTFSGCFWTEWDLWVIFALILMGNKKIRHSAIAKPYS